MQKELSLRNVLMGLGVAAGVAAAFIVRMCWDDGPPLIKSVKPLTAQQIVVRDLGWAEQQSVTGLGRRLDPVHDLFNQARQGARAFADDALGWDSKWALVTDFVSSKNEHSQYLQEQFSKRMFSPDQLESALQASVGGYMKHLEDIDSQLLVRLQADLSGVPTEQLSPSIDRGAIRKLIDEALAQAKQAAESDFRGMIGREIASLVAGEVLSAAAIELATSSGILGAGAASGTVTFGAGLVVGVIADCAVSWAYDKLFDPVGELTKRVNQQLDQLERMIVTGSPERPGLELRLRDYSQRRGKARDMAIRSALLSGRPTIEL